MRVFIIICLIRGTIDLTGIPSVNYVIVGGGRNWLMTFLQINNKKCIQLIFGNSRLVRLNKNFQLQRRVQIRSISLAPPPSNFELKPIQIVCTCLYLKQNCLYLDGFQIIPNSKVEEILNSEFRGEPYTNRLLLVCTYLFIPLVKSFVLRQFSN